MRLFTYPNRGRAFSTLGIVVGLAVFLFAACDSSPTGVATDDLDVNLTFSTDHIHTLSEVSIQAEVTGPDGSAFTNFDVLQVEIRGHEETDWRSIELTRSGDHFSADYTFMSSGDHDLRVRGQIAGRSTLRVLHERSGHLEVGRAHVEKNGYRVEFENFPGHAHEGEEVTVKFWVLSDGNPVEGLDAEIHCTDPAGAEENHGPHQHEGGVYEAHHTLEGAGEAHFAIHFPGNSGEIEADFHVPIAHGH